jgi:MFS family permease
MEQLTAAARRNERLYYLFTFLMDFGLWFGIWIKYLTVSRGFELRWIFLMDLPFWLMVATLEAPFGALADRFGHSRVLALGAGVFALTIFGFGFTTNYWLLFTDYMLWAVAMACRSGADQAIIYDSLKAAGQEDRFAKVVGRGFSIMLTAGLTGIILGGVVAAETSLAFTVKVSLVGPVLAIFVALAMVEPKAVHTGRHYLEGLKQGVAFAWHTPQVRYSVMLGSLMATGSMVPVLLAQPFLIEHDVATGLFGIYQAPLRIAAVVTALFAYRIAAAAGAPRVFASALLMTVLTYIGLAAFDSLPAFSLFMVPALFQGIVRPTMDTYINNQTPSDRRATVLSVASLAFSVQVAFLEPAIGFVIDGISLQAAAGMTAIFFLVAGPPVLFLWRRAYHEHPLVTPEAVAAAAAG